MIDTFQSTKLVKVTTDAEYRCAKTILEETFTDPTDLEPEEELDRFFQTPDIAQYFLFLHLGKPIGAGLARVNPAVPHAMYVPYTGIRNKDRGIIPFTTMRHLFADLMREMGVRRILVDVEDPPRVLLHNVYPDETVIEIEKRCEQRLRWFQRGLNTTFVDDPDRTVAYQRPASDDPSKIQAYDLLGFAPIEPNDPELTNHYSPDRTSLTVDMYRKLFIELMQIEFGTEDRVPTPNELIDAYPAIEEFMERLNLYSQTNSWVKLRPKKRK